MELFLTAVLPIIIVSIKRYRTSPYALGVAAFSASFGLVLNRMDVGIFGYFRDAGTIYFPSFGEWALSIGVVAGATLAFIYISEQFTIFDNQWESKKVERSIFSAAFDSFSRVWTTALHNGVYRISLIAVFVIPAAFVLLYPPYAGTSSETIEPATGADVERTVLLINGNSNDEITEFPHEAHKERLGGTESCISCHHMSMPNDNSTPCAQCHKSMLTETSIFEHTYHTEKVAQANNLTGMHPENKTCWVCHQGEQVKTKENAVNCTKCHLQDMQLEKSEINKTPKFIFATSYMDAMHKNCVGCHVEKEHAVAKKLSDCSTCHKGNIEMKMKDKQFARR